MPYRKVGQNDYVSPNGKHINRNQLRLWYANGQKWPGEKHSESGMAYAKGGDVRPASYAKGGAVLGRTRDFLKTYDDFREGSGKNDESWGKGSGDNLAKRSGDKSLKAVKPRK